MWFANCSVWPQYVNKALPQLVKVFFSPPPHLSCAVLHPSSLYPGSTFAPSSYFCSPRCIDNFQQKYDFSLFYRAKNLIADSSIQLCFTGVENNKQGGGLLFQTLNMRLLFKRDLMRLQEAIDDNYIRTWLFPPQTLRFIWVMHRPKTEMWQRLSRLVLLLSSREGRVWSHLGVTRPSLILHGPLFTKCHIFVQIFHDGNNTQQWTMFYNH